MNDQQTNLDEVWQVRNAAVMTLMLCEEQMHRAVREATTEQLVALIENFSPARSTGPDWTRSFEALVERLWAWRDDAMMADVASVFRARGMPWLAVANALSPEQGARQRVDLRQPAWARQPAFTTV